MPQALLSCCSVVPSSKLIGCLLVNLSFGVTLVIRFMFTSVLRPLGSDQCLRSAIVFWLSQTDHKVPVWVVRKTLASTASQSRWPQLRPAEHGAGIREALVRAERATEAQHVLHAGGARAARNLLTRSGNEIDTC